MPAPTRSRYEECADEADVIVSLVGGAEAHLAHPPAVRRAQFNFMVAELAARMELKRRAARSHITRALARAQGQEPISNWGGNRRS